MRRTRTSCWLCLLLALFLLSATACATTQQPNYTAMTLCLAGFGLEIAAAVTDKPLLLIPAIMSWFGCGAASAYTPHTPTEYPQIIPPERVQADGSAM